PQPLRGLELPADSAEIRRVVAEDAVQRAAVGQLEKEPQRWAGNAGCERLPRGVRSLHGGFSGPRIAHGRSSSQVRSTARVMNAQTSAVSPAAPYVCSRSATMSATVRTPSHRVRIAAAL